MFELLLGVLLTAEPAPDLRRGEEIYRGRCIACHSLSENGAGPSHQRLFGRRAGSQPGYDYSEALRGSTIVWNEFNLDQWLSDPGAFIPGNKMMVRLANDPVDRANLIAWLRVVTSKE